MLEKLIRKIAERLDADKIPYMIIGPEAMLLYGTPRLARDIDIILGVHIDKFPLIRALCKKLNLNLLTENTETVAREPKVFPTRQPESGIRANFIFSFTGYEAQAIKKAEAVLLDDYPVKFASWEDRMFLFITWLQGGVSKRRT